MAGRFRNNLTETELLFSRPACVLAHDSSSTSVVRSDHRIAKIQFLEWDLTFHEVYRKGFFVGLRIEACSIPVEASQTLPVTKICQLDVLEFEDVIRSLQPFLLRNQSSFVKKYLDLKSNAKRSEHMNPSETDTESSHRFVDEATKVGTDSLAKKVREALRWVDVDCDILERTSQSQTDGGRTRRVSISSMVCRHIDPSGNMFQMFCEILVAGCSTFSEINTASKRDAVKLAKLQYRIPSKQRSPNFVNLLRGSANSTSSWDAMRTLLQIQKKIDSRSLLAPRPSVFRLVDSSSVAPPSIHSSPFNVDIKTLTHDAILKLVRVSMADSLLQDYLNDSVWRDTLDSEFKSNFDLLESLYLEVHNSKNRVEYLAAFRRAGVSVSAPPAQVRQACEGMLHKDDNSSNLDLSKLQREHLHRGSSDTSSEIKSKMTTAKDSIGECDFISIRDNTEGYDIFRMRRQREREKLAACEIQIWMRKLRSSGMLKNAMRKLRPKVYLRWMQRMIIAQAVVRRFIKRRTSKKRAAKAFIHGIAQDGQSITSEQDILNLHSHITHLRPSVNDAKGTATASGSSEDRMASKSETLVDVMSDPAVPTYRDYNESLIDLAEIRTVAAKAKCNAILTQLQIAMKPFHQQTSRTPFAREVGQTPLSSEYTKADVEKLNQCVMVADGVLAPANPALQEAKQMVAGIRVECASPDADGGCFESTSCNEEMRELKAAILAARTNDDAMPRLEMCLDNFQHSTKNSPCTDKLSKNISTSSRVEHPTKFSMTMPSNKNSAEFEKDVGIQPNLSDQSAQPSPGLHSAIVIEAQNLLRAWKIELNTKDLLLGSN